MAPLAILLLVRAATHSYAVAGVAVGAYALANAGCAPLQGRLVDRFGRFAVLVPSALAQAASLLALTVSARVQAAGAVLVVLSAFAGAFAPPVAPAVRAVLRDVFHDGALLDSAYALDSVLQEVAWISGPLVVALVIAVTSPSGAVALIGGLYIVGTCLFVRSPLARGGDRRVPDQRASALTSPQLRALLAPVALTGIGFGAIEVGLPALALHAGSRPASGLLLALWSLGSLAGGVWYGARVWHSPLASRYRLVLALAIVLDAPLIIARSIPAGVVCSLLAGATIAPMFSCQYALVSRTVTTGSRNRGLHLGFGGADWGRRDRLGARRSHRRAGRRERPVPARARRVDVGGGDRLTRAGTDASASLSWLPSVSQCSQWMSATVSAMVGMTTAAMTSVAVTIATRRARPPHRPSRARATRIPADRRSAARARRCHMSASLTRRSQRTVIRTASRRSRN